MPNYDIDSRKIQVVIRVCLRIRSPFISLSFSANANITSTTALPCDCGRFSVRPRSNFDLKKTRIMLGAVLGAVTNCHKNVLKVFPTWTLVSQRVRCTSNFTAKLSRRRRRGMNVRPGSTWKNEELKFQERGHFFGFTVIVCVIFFISRNPMNSFLIFGCTQSSSSVSRQLVLLPLLV